LAQAEYLEFENARTRFAQAQTDFRLYRLTQANNKYRDVHRMLKNIDFYQNLQSGNGFIDKSEYKNLYKLSLLGIIQSYALQPETMTQVKEYFDQYLEIENDPATMERLEEFLTERGWLEITPGGQNNPLRLYYRIHLDYKQSRYREIIGFVQLAEEMTYDLPGQYRDELNDIFRLIGNAYQNIDFLYDAVDMYEKALQLIPNDWRTLFQLRASYVRFNNQEKIAEVDKRLSMILTNREEIFNRVKLEKNQGWAYPFLLRPGNFIINMAITPEKTMFPPLVSIYLNGEIIQEDYVPVSASSGEIILPVSLDSVQNHLQIKSINQDIYLETFNIRNHDE
jgi:tetratricopeptide (TPR) repeat protein